MDVWEAVAARRCGLADRVSGLDAASLDAASWCDGWRVRDVLGHLTYLAEATTRRVAADILRRGLGRPDRALDRTARTLAERPVDELAARLRAAAGGRFHVPGSPPVVALGELLVHGADLLRPLGLDDDVDPAEACAVVPAYRRIGRVAFHARPAAGVTLVATDADLRSGSGPEVHGRAIDLLLLLANRRQVLDRLEGPGVARVA